MNKGYEQVTKRELSLPLKPKERYSVALIKTNIQTKASLTLFFHSFMGKCPHVS